MGQQPQILKKHFDRSFCFMFKASNENLEYFLVRIFPYDIYSTFGKRKTRENSKFEHFSRSACDGKRKQKPVNLLSSIT